MAHDRLQKVQRYKCENRKTKPGKWEEVPRQKKRREELLCSAGQLCVTVASATRAAALDFCNTNRLKNPSKATGGVAIRILPTTTNVLKLSRKTPARLFHVHCGSSAKPGVPEYQHASRIRTIWRGPTCWLAHPALVSVCC